MKWLKAALSLVLAAFWPLAASHCDLEQLSSLDFLTCSPHADSTSHEESDCHSDGCAVIEAGLYKTEERQITVSPPMLAIVSVVLSPAVNDSLFVVVPIPPSSPPALSCLWQFAQRAAAPPRAPSIVS